MSTFIPSLDFKIGQIMLGCWNVWEVDCSVSCNHIYNCPWVENCCNDLKFTTCMTSSML